MRIFTQTSSDNVASNDEKNWSLKRSTLCLVRLSGFTVVDSVGDGCVSFGIIIFYSYDGNSRQYEIREM